MTKSSTSSTIRDNYCNGSTLYIQRLLLSLLPLLLFISMTSWDRISTAEYHVWIMVTRVRLPAVPAVAYPPRRRRRGQVSCTHMRISGWLVCSFWGCIPTARYHARVMVTRVRLPAAPFLWLLQWREVNFIDDSWRYSMTPPIATATTAIHIYDFLGPYFNGRIPCSDHGDQSFILVIYM